MRRAKGITHAGIRILGVAIVMLCYAASSRASQLREPQVVFPDSSLRFILQSLGSPISPATGQLDKQVWAGVELEGCYVDLMLIHENQVAASVGLYDADATNPTLFEIFPEAARPGWYVTLAFSATKLSVALFDADYVYQGSFVYTGVDPLHLGLYVHVAATGSTYFSQDDRNADGVPQVLSYASDPIGPWDPVGSGETICIATTPYSSISTTFTDIILITPGDGHIPDCNWGTPTRRSTWGDLKTHYR